MRLSFSKRVPILSAPKTTKTWEKPTAKPKNNTNRSSSPMKVEMPKGNEGLASEAASVTPNCFLS